MPPPTLSDTLRVELGANSYPIWIGDGLLADPATTKTLLGDKLTSSQVVVVSNDRVSPLYMDCLLYTSDAADE